MTGGEPDLTSANSAPGDPQASAQTAEQVREDERLAEKLTKHNDFLMGVVSMSQLPPADRPEVAFAGRSNVGKSSLINALVMRKNLARASNTPGRTRELNFFVNEELGYLVDLPGYGYASAPKDAISKWVKLTRKYLVGRPNLRRVFCLVDSRHGLKDADKELMAELSKAAVSFQVLLTKADKIKAKELAAVMDKTRQLIAKMPASHPVVLPTSSEKKQGLVQARANVARALLGL